MRNVALLAVVCCGLMALSSCGSRSAAPEEWVEEGREADAEVVDPQAVARAREIGEQMRASKVEVVQLSQFPGGLELRKTYGPSDVHVDFLGAKTDGIAEAQRAAIREFVANEKTVFQNVRAAIYEHYRTTFLPYREKLRKSMHETVTINGTSADQHKFMQELFERDFPEIKNGDELDGLVTLLATYVHRPVNGVAKIGLYFECSWDRDEGLGVRIAGTTVEAVGRGVEASPQ
jgi:hypothetical protein